MAEPRNAARIVGLIDDSMELAADSARCLVLVRPDLPVLAGHFPGHPVFPGALMLSGLAALASRAFGLGAPARLRDAKFRREVSPDTRLVYRVTREARENWRAVEASVEAIVTGLVTFYAAPHEEVVSVTYEYVRQPLAPREA